MLLVAFIHPSFGRRHGILTTAPQMALGFLIYRRHEKAPEDLSKTLVYLVAGVPARRSFRPPGTAIPYPSLPLLTTARIRRSAFVVPLSVVSVRIVCFCRHPLLYNTVWGPLVLAYNWMRYCVWISTKQGVEFSSKCDSKMLTASLR